jgi:two-component system heavy metal sensor histidine kinase CusS
MASIAPADRFPPPVDSALLPSLKQVARLESDSGGPYNALAVRARNLLTDESWLIQVAMDRHDHDALLAKLRQGALFALLLGTLASGAAGILAARRGMKPLHDIAVAAERITATQLNERIDPARWPSELGALAIALNRMLSRLEEAFVRMSQCTAEVAHELRTPIQNLMGEAGVALAARRTPEEYRHVLESSLEEYERLSRMINEMLFLARAEDPKQQLVRERFDVRREMEAVREFFDALSESRGVTVSCQGAGDIEANALLLRRALTNLLSNALRHTPRGGHVVLAVENPTGQETLIQVADSGHGIPREELQQLRARRRRNARLRAPGTLGSGLGLPIVKSIVELHGGSVSLNSSPGNGTCVLLRFPRAQAGAPPP